MIKNKIRYFITVAGWWAGIMFLLAACGTGNKLSQKSDPPMEAGYQSLLSEEEQRKYDYFFLEASRLKAAGEPDAAFDMLCHCIVLDPEAPEALFEISQFYLYLRQPEKSEEALRKAVKNDPDNFWYNQALVGFYQQQGKRDEALEALESMARRFPDRREPIFGLIDLYSQTQDYSKLITALDKLEERIGKSEELTLEKFRIYLQMGDEKKAFREVENLSAEYPNDFRYKILVGDFYLQNGKEDEAYKIFREVLEAEPDNALALYALANYYQATGRKEEYEAQIDTLLLSPKVDPEIKLGVMQKLIMRNEQAEGDSIRIIRLFDTILERDREDTNIPMLYSQYLYTKGMKEEAIPVLERIIDLDPENLPARLQLLSNALMANDYAGVIRISEPAILATPNALEFYFYLAIAYHQEKREEDAVEISRKALLQVDDATDKKIVSDFYNIMGDIYHTQDKVTEAFAAYDSALVYNPENIPVLNNYAYYLSLERRDLDRAEEMSYKTIKAEPNNATYLDTYAWILFEKGRYADAKIYIDDAMKNGGEESDVVVEHAGDIYCMTGDKEKALEYWKQALEMGSESETLKKKVELKKYIHE
ncbi:MAG: tetratricopeptide repeat protein [Bacteroides sp.]|nr:tetratricopeptide repeat protein [Bacteroides sp.]